MRKFLIILLIFIHKIALCQLNDNFEDGDFTSNPEWIASNDNQDFIVNENGQLQSNSTVAPSNFYISTVNTKALNCVWEFDCNLRFTTSGNNYADVYLISNAANLQSNTISGYFIRIGNTTDEISLYRRNGALNSSVKIIDGTDNVVSSSSNNPFRIRVTRTHDGEFTLEWDRTQTGSNYQTEGTVTDNTFTTTSWFGVYIQQSTATFHQKHFFDNFIIKDITPPELISLVTENNQIILSFDKSVDTDKANNLNNYQLHPGNISPVSVTTNNNIVTLNFNDDLETGNYTLTIHNIEDLKGNAIETPIIKNFNYIKPYFAKPNDIVINEIFADPSPQIDLPATEFIELWNTTSETISLKGYKYSDLTTTYTFGDDFIYPNEYLILCARNDTTEYKKYGRVIGITPWPSLNNASDLLTLSDSNGTIIHSVNYSDTWYKDATKKNGGYTLELIDPFSTCISAQNYIASNDVSGGTPGKQNSVYLTNKPAGPLTLVSASLKDSTTIIINFNHSVDSLQASLIAHYSINNGIGTPESVKLIAPYFSSAELYYTAPLTKERIYTVTVNGVADCGNNAVNNQSALFTYPGDIDKKDILINEVLFNPRPGGYDFVEVYNNSNKTLDFKDLFLATTNDKDSVITIRSITDTAILFEPGTYWVLTTEPDNIKSEYHTTAPDNFIKMSSMPAYNDDKGTVLLLNNRQERIDQLNYNKNMHFALLKDVEGVSLERSFFNEETNKPGNFRSATATVGYATPAYKNSQYLDKISNSTEHISLSSKVFSPDNDGFDDILAINYDINSVSSVANVKIYNDNGKLVKKLINNEPVSNTGNWIWDGMDSSNSRVNAGIYILYIEFFDLDGNTQKYKNAVGVAYRN